MSQEYVVTKIKETSPEPYIVFAGDKQAAEAIMFRALMGSQDTPIRNLNFDRGYAIAVIENEASFVGGKKSGSRQIKVTYYMQPVEAANY